MRKIFIIMWKEIRDNLRDRRSLFFALVYSPILMPALMIGPLILNADRYRPHYETPITVHVQHRDRAPNLLEYLHGKNIDVETAPEDYRAKIAAGDTALVLEIPATYGEKFVEGSPARVILHYDREDNDSQRIFRRVKSELAGYSRSIASQRMAIRGFDGGLLQPLDIVENDLSEDDFAAGTIANIIMFSIIFSMMMGGFYLAIDTTAGERERLSLEPLLSLAVTRLQVALGKYLAILTFVVVAFLMPLASVAVWVSFIPEPFFGDAEVPSLRTYASIMILTAPLCLFIVGFLMAIAAFSKSSKEAQTQLSLAMLVLMAPFFVVQFADIKLGPVSGAVPILSQYLLADKIMMDAGFSLLAMLPGACATLAAGAVFFAIAVYLYSRDSILG